MSILSILILASTLISSFSQSIPLGVKLPHDKTCYSQGLFFINNTHLFESCGIYKKSYLHVLEFTQNPLSLKETFVSKKPLKQDLFFQGAVEFKNYIYILTWQENIVLKIHPTTFQIVQQLKWPKSGWGLTANATHMFISDGTNKIYLVDQSFEIIKQQPIKDINGRSFRYINELEFINGYIYANIYFNNKIVKIDFEKGKVVEEFDGTDMIKTEKAAVGLKNDEVFNGIAYHKATKKVLLTGKNWGHLYFTEFQTYEDL